MPLIEKICRYSLALFLLLAVLFVAMGDLFFPFVDHAEPPQSAQEFLISLTAADYVWPSTGAILLLGSAMLCFRKVVGLALVILFPIILHVVLYTIFLDHSVSTIRSKVVLILLFLLVGILNRQSFRSLIGR